MEAEFSEYFRAPASYDPPRDEELDGSTQFPNLNSIEFRHRQNDGRITLLPFFEQLVANEDQSTILLATNSYNQRLWNGAVFGYGRFADIGQPNAAVMQISVDANVTRMSFVEKSIVLCTTSTGSIQIWSTHSEVRQKHGYSLYQVAKKTEHFGLITGLSILGTKATAKAVTGSSDGCLKVWTVAPCDIVSERTYRMAHNATVTDISSKPASDDIFVSMNTSGGNNKSSCFIIKKFAIEFQATSSRDRYVSIWDKRSQKPLVNTYKNEDYAYTACFWLNNNGEERLYVGDDTGTMCIFDPRMLNAHLVSKPIFDRPIHKFRLNPTGKLLGVLGQTNSMAVINTTPEADIVYRYSSATDYVRDICWVNNNSQTEHVFHSVGWGKHVAQHKIETTPR